MARICADGGAFSVPVSDISDDDLLRRAVTGARSRTHGRRYHWRWVAVMDVFALGSSFAHELCRRFGLDPDEKVRR